MTDWLRPLGDYERMAEWTRSPHSWGPDGGNVASFAGRVIADLVAGIEAFPAVVDDSFPGKAEAYPVAIGCVPWLTSQRVAAALSTMSTLIVVDKGARHYSAVRQLAASAHGVWQPLLHLEEWAPAGPDGSAPILGPLGPMPGDNALGPVRCVGWNRIGQRATPMLHAKLLVLAAAFTWENDYGGGWSDHLRPMRVWLGSANWTEAADKHLELGVWIDDADLAERCLGFLTDLVTFSEPFESATAGPEPDLVPAEYDDEAFREYLDEWRAEPD